MSTIFISDVIVLDAVNGLQQKHERNYNFTEDVGVQYDLLDSPFSINLASLQNSSVLNFVGSLEENIVGTCASTLTKAFRLAVDLVFNGYTLTLNFGAQSITFTEQPSKNFLALTDPNDLDITGFVNPATSIVSGDLRGSYALPKLSPAALQNGMPSGRLPHWLAAVARVQSKSGTGKIAYIGDSTTLGRGASGADFPANRILSTPVQLARMLKHMKIPANADTFVFPQGGIQPTYDPRIVFNAGWGQTNVTLGGTLVNNTTTINSLDLTPEGIFDTIEATITGKLAGAGQAFVTVDGGSHLGTGIAFNSTTVDLAQAKTTLTCPRGLHTINIIPTDAVGKTHFVSHLRVLDSINPAISIYNFGISGALASAFADASSQISPITCLEFLAPDLTIINLTINDSNQSTALATYQANLQTIITAAKLSGDVVLLIGNPYSPPPANYAAYVAVAYLLADTNNCPLVDITSRWGSYAIMNPIMPYFDTVHPLKEGYSDIASAVLAKITEGVHTGPQIFANDLPVALAVGASPYVYKNGATAQQQVIVQGGTVSAIEFSRNGSTFINIGATAGLVVLNPGDNVRVTYSVLPTMTTINLS